MRRTRLLRGICGFWSRCSILRSLQNSHPMTSAAKRIAELREQIRFHDRKYYEESRPVDQRPRIRPADAGADRPGDGAPGAGHARFADAARRRRRADGAEARPARRADDEHRQHVQRGGGPGVRRARPQGCSAASSRRTCWSRRSTARRSACATKTAGWCWPRRAGAGTSATTSPSTPARSSRFR